MSTDVANHEGRGQAQIHCEPFVYTSMATRFGTGYHLVARGEKLSRNAPEDVQEMVEFMVSLAQAADAESPILAYFSTTGPAPLSVVVKCSANFDWQGRPGGFCSGLAFHRDELAKLPGRCVHAFDLPALPFLTQEQLEGHLRMLGADVRDCLYLKGGAIAARLNYAQSGDRSFLLAHLPSVVIAARRLAAGDSLNARDNNEAWRSLRLVNLLFPPDRRAGLSFISGTRRSTKNAARVLLWAGSAFENMRHEPALLVPNSEKLKGVEPALVSYLASAVARDNIGSAELDQLFNSIKGSGPLADFWRDLPDGKPLTDPGPSGRRTSRISDGDSGTHQFGSASARTPPATASQPPDPALDRSAREKYGNILAKERSSNPSQRRIYISAIMAALFAAVLAGIYLLWKSPDSDYIADKELNEASVSR